jgi:hypothetical protein
MAGLSLCGVDRVCALVGQRTPPRRARGQPLHPIQARSPLDEAQTKELAARVERAVAALPSKEAQVIRRRFGVSLEAAGPEPARSRSARKLEDRVIDA